MLCNVSGLDAVEAGVFGAAQTFADGPCPSGEFGIIGDERVDLPMPATKDRTAKD